MAAASVPNRAHADGATDALLGEHAIYRALGRGGEARGKGYRALFRGALDGEFVAALRAATNGGWALGHNPFRTYWIILDRNVAYRLPRSLANFLFAR